MYRLYCTSIANSRFSRRLKMDLRIRSKESESESIQENSKSETSKVLNNLREQHLWRQLQSRSTYSRSDGAKPSFSLLKTLRENENSLPHPRQVSKFKESSPLRQTIPIKLSCIFQKFILVPTTAAIGKPKCSFSFSLLLI